MHRTDWRIRFACINWTVEWVLQDGTKAISKCYETTAIGTAYTNLENNKLKRKRGIDNSTDTRAPRIAKTTETVPVSLNVPSTSNVKSATPTESAIVETVAEKAPSEKETPLPLLDEVKVKPAEAEIPPSTDEQPTNDKSDDLCFYLHRPQTASKVPVLKPLLSTQTLREGLQNATVLEFPTIYVLRLSPEAIQKSDKYILEKDHQKKSNETVLEGHPKPPPETTADSS